MKAQFVLLHWPAVRSFLLCEVVAVIVDSVPVNQCSGYGIQQAELMIWSKCAAFSGLTS